MTFSSAHGDTGSRSQREDFELPLFEFERIAKATNNFSYNNKLGEGGFGPVYMVVTSIPYMALLEFKSHQ